MSFDPTIILVHTICKYYELRDKIEESRKKVITKRLLSDKHKQGAKRPFFCRIIRYFFRMMKKSIWYVFDYDVYKMHIECAGLLHDGKAKAIKKVRIASLLDYSTDIDIVEAEMNRKICIPCFFEKRTEQLFECSSPPSVVVTLENVYLFGQTNIILTEDQKNNLSNAYYDTNKRVDLSYGYLIATKNNSIYYADTESEYIEKGIYLVNPANYNYFHFVIETLSRLIVINNYNKYDEYPVIVDECIRLIPQFMEVLNLVAKKREIIFAKSNVKYKVAKLIYATGMIWMPCNVKHGFKMIKKDYALSGRILYELKESLERNVHNTTPYRKVYLSRKNTSNSRLTNEEEITELFRESGYEIIQPEDLSVTEQIYLFSSSRIIVGTTGGALTNIIYCQRGTIIACIIPEEFEFYMYSNIAYHLGLRNIFLCAEIVNHSKYIASESFRLEVEYAREFVNSMEIES